MLEAAALALGRIKIGRPAKSFIAVGLRGVGKTVIMNQVQQIAEQQGYHSVYIEAYDEIRLPVELARRLRPVLLSMSAKAKIRDIAARALAGLRNFASVFEIKAFEVGLAVKPEPGLADTGDITADLPDLLVAIGEAAKANQTALAIIIAARILGT